MKRHAVVAMMAAVMAFGLAACDDDDDEGTNEYEAVLNGQNERPTAVTTTATGAFTLVDNGASMAYTLTVNNITGPITGAHIHAIPRSGVAPADTTGGIVVNLNPAANVTTGTLAQGVITQASISGLGGAAAISMDSLRTLINAGRTYVNVHTQANTAGHIRGTIVRD
jgi:Cu/Zn superoxide dismutase